MPHAGVAQQRLGLNFGPLCRQQNQTHRRTAPLEHKWNGSQAGRSRRRWDCRPAFFTPTGKTGEFMFSGARFEGSSRSGKEKVVGGQNDRRQTVQNQRIRSQSQRD